MKLNSLLLLMVSGFTFLGFGEVEITFEGGFQSGIEASSQWKEDTYDGKIYPYADVRMMNAGTTHLVNSTVSVPAGQLPVSDNLRATVTLSNVKPASLAKIDKFQLVISTNNWNDVINIGEPFDYYDSDSTDVWISHQIDYRIEGLCNCTEFYYGLKAIAAGWSGNKVFLKALRLDSLAGVACDRLAFDTVPKIGDERAVVSATIRKSPSDAISSLSVWAEIERNGFVYTNQMFEVENGLYTNNVLRVDTTNADVPELHPLDAGDLLRVQVFTKYSSSIDAMGDADDEISGRYIEKSAELLEYTVPQSGSVWINEFSLGQVEICGTTNRTYMSGWTLNLVDANKNIVAAKTFNAAFCFQTNMLNNKIGLGLELHELGWSIPILNNPYSLRLANAAGVIEHQIDSIEFSGADIAFCMKGVAPWPEEGEGYDWSGTATNGTFTFEAETITTFGLINEGQSFEISCDGSFRVRTIIQVDEVYPEPFAGANVGYELDWSSGSVGGSIQTEEDGWTSVVEFSGSHTNYDCVFATFGVSAFGWLAKEQRIPLSFNMLNDGINIPLEPTVAEDDFSDVQLPSYWSKSGTGAKDFTYHNLNGNGVVRFDSRMLNAGQYYAALQCNNPLMARGKGCANISFSVRNAASNGNKPDYACIQIATNDNFTGESIAMESKAVLNSVAGIAANNWNTGTTFIKWPADLGNTAPMYVRIRGEAAGWSGNYLDVDNIRIAFQDMATITNLLQTGMVDEPEFAIDVEPWCEDGQSVSNVSVDLVMDVNGTVFTNHVPWADGGLTNALSETMTFTVSSDVINAGLNAAIGQPQLRVGDSVKYWAQVNYYADSRDPDPAKEWETRFFPDNTTVDNEGRWTVEGEYGVDMSKVANDCVFTIPGDPISLNGDFIPSETGVVFGFRAYDTAGVSSVTATISAAGAEAQIFTFVTNGVVRYDNEVSATGLAANTEYTVTITATDVNGNALAPATFTFTTLPVATSAVIEGMTPNAVQLTVSGSAAGYVVPSGWTQTSANTWTRGGLTPNTEVTATGIYATNKVGAASAAIDATPGYTFAVVATKAPAIEKGVTTVTVGAGEDYAPADDGNPEGTEYAVRVTTSNGRDALIASETGDAIWKTLAAWQETPVEVVPPTIDLAATNYFSFVTRNFDGDETVNDAPVTTNCWFEMTAGFADGKADQAASPFGSVDVSLNFTDPAQSADAQAEVEYKIGSGEWTPLCSFPVPFDEILSSTNLEWDAWAAVGQAQGTYEYSLRARVSSGNRASEWSEISGSLDFAPPSEPTITGLPGTLTNQKSFTLTASGSTDPNGVTYCWTFNGVVTEGNTLDVVTVADGDYTVSVKAVDAMGNESAAANVSWKLDATAPAPAPTVSGLPGALTNQKSFTLTASGSTDDNGVTYRWTFNDATTEGDTFNVSTEADGEYSVSVVAVDNAGNKSEATTVSWTLDATAPAPAPTVTGLPSALTNQKAFTLTASGSTDPHNVTYRWTFNGQTATGNSFNVATTADGNYTVSVIAVDDAGNESAATTVSWKLDATAPAPAPTVTGLPSALTNQKSFTLTASGSTDPNGVTYRWTFNGATTDGNTLAVATETDGDYSVSVVAVDNAGNVSEATTLSWKLDATAPAPAPAVAGLPGALTNQKSFTLTASGSADPNGVTYRWTFNDQTAEGDTFDVSTAADGDYSVSVVAVDNAGNASEATTVSWKLDATVPTLPVVSGNPAAGSVVNDEAFSFTAASEDATEVLYHWIIGEREETFAKDIPFVGNAAEGTNTVGVYATDLAGNVSATNTFSWVLDTINPSDPVILGKPAVLSKVPGFAMSAVSQDATALTYHWTIVGGAGSSSGDDGSVFSGTSAEGTNTVSVYATDEAGNVSTTVVYEWVLDTTKPTELAVEGTSGVVATKDFSFTASADDATEVIFRWSITGGGTGAADGEGDAVFSGTAVEGTNTVSVYAEDAAGNRCDPVEIKWVVDMTAPTAPEFTVKPGNPTKIPMFAVTAASEDATCLTYHWTITGGSGGTDALDSAKFSGIAVEGLNTVSVYATDEAGNESPASTYEWKLDTMVPSKLNIAGTSGVVGTLDFVFTASAEDDSMPIAYRWLLNGVEADSTAAEFTGTVPEGTNTVVVSAIDAAGNECGAIEHTWVADVTAPTEPQVSGVPGEVTNVKSFTLTASGTTDVHQFTYNWIFGEQTAEGETFDVAVEDDDVYEVLVYARDEAGNSSTTNKVAWTLDTSAPKDLAIGGTPEAGSSVNTGAYSFTASAKDATAVRYSWTFGETKGEGETFAGTVSEDGVYTVSVVAVDAAGNESEPVALTWTYDTVHPTVELTTASLDPFNEARAPWIVTATFSEVVTNFTAQSVTVSENATVGNVVQILESETPTYTFEVTPSIDGDVTVSIAAGAVADAAGNGNEASNELTRRYDATKPTVTLSADVGRYFTNDVFTVTATFSEVVTKFTAAGITVDNGAVAGEISGSGSVYAFAVEPAVQNGEVSISISADAATDAAGNGNEASEPLTLTRDTIGPSKPVISGTPENGATVDNAGFTFTAETSDAVSKPEDMTYFWVVDGKILTLAGAPDLGIEVTGSGWNRARMRTLTGKVTETRTYTIYVVARDEAGNSSPQSDVWTWTYTPSSSQDVEFGDGICVKVDPDTGVTNSVSFTSVDFRPGETSTFVLDGFDASTQEIEEFAMWFVVKDTLDDDAERRVRVNSGAVFDSEKGELTVTLPPEAIEGKDSLFIIGIDNAGK